jgi:hypothetical protein
MCRAYDDAPWVIDAIDRNRHRWSAVRLDEPELPIPDLRTAAQAVALQRSRDAALRRGVWP